MMCAMMTLTQYLEAKKITQAEFAGRIGATQGTVSKLCAGRNPSWRLAARIARATDNEVPVTIWAQLAEDDAA